MAHKIVFHKQKHAFRVLINVNRRRPKGVTHTANENMRNKTSSTRQTVKSHYYKMVASTKKRKAILALLLIMTICRQQ